MRYQGQSGRAASRGMSRSLMILLGLAALVVVVAVGVVAGLMLAPRSSQQAANQTVRQPPQSAPAPRVTRQQDFGDWRMACTEVPAPGTGERCGIVQQLLDAQTRGVVFIWRVVQDGRGGLVALWQAPEAILLTGGLRIDVGGPQPIAIPFEACGAGSCRATANLAADFVGTLSRAEKLAVSLVRRDRTSVTLNLSVKGLRDALAALGPVTTPAPAPRTPGAAAPAGTTPPAAPPTASAPANPSAPASSTPAAPVPPTPLRPPAR